MANSTLAVKFASGSDDEIEILAIPYSGPLSGGRDTDGEYFSKRTDLCLDWFPNERPLIYDHGMDRDGPGVSVVGRTDAKTMREDEHGRWVKAQLDKSNAYYQFIKQLIGHGVLHGSSGAMPHLTQKARSGEILRWPWVEQSLTPTPANLFSTVALAEAQKHYKSAGLDFALSPALADAMEASLLPAQKAGRVLSAANEARIRRALAEITDVLGTTGH